MQPLEDDSGVIRFKSNAIVRLLLDDGRYDLNRLAMHDFPQEDWEQFYQLIGYSLGGYHELSDVSDESALAATEQARAQGLVGAAGCRMKAVWKFTFPVKDKVIITMPEGARVVSVGTQVPNEICLWALVTVGSPSRPETQRTFHVRGTGPSVEEEIAHLYIGTVFDGPFVWHVFGEN